jgi:hypothetical protein
MYVWLSHLPMPNRNNSHTSNLIPDPVTADLRLRTPHFILIHFQCQFSGAWHISTFYDLFQHYRLYRPTWRVNVTYQTRSISCSLHDLLLLFHFTHNILLTHFFFLHWSRHTSPTSFFSILTPASCKHQAYWLFSCPQFVSSLRIYESYKVVNFFNENILMYLRIISHKYI